LVRGTLRLRRRPARLRRRPRDVALPLPHTAAKRRPGDQGNCHGFLWLREFKALERATGSRRSDPGKPAAARQTPRLGAAKNTPPQGVRFPAPPERTEPAPAAPTRGAMTTAHAITRFYGAAGSALSLSRTASSRPRPSKACRPAACLRSVSSSCIARSPRTTSR
jgi:hypothetical protein